MTVLIDAEKAFDKTQHTHSTALMIETLSKPGVERGCLNLVKNIDKNPAANIILDGESLDIFPLRSGLRQGCSLSLPWYWTCYVFSKTNKEKK